MTLFHAPLFFVYFCIVNKRQALFDLLVQRTRQVGLLERGLTVNG